MCVLTCGARREQTIGVFIQGALSVCASRTRSRPGAAPGRLPALPGSLVRPARENAALSGLLLWNPAASHTCISRFLATHANAEPFPSIHQKENFCLTETIQSVPISSNGLTVSTFLKGKRIKSFYTEK